MLLHHTALYLVSRVLTALATFFSLWLFSRLFAPAVYGFYVTVVTIGTVVNIAFFQWLRVTYIRHMPESEDPAQLRSVALSIFLATLLLFTVLALPLTLMFPDGEWAQLVPSIILVSWAMAWSEFSLDMLRAKLEPKSYLLFSGLRDGLQVLLVVLFLKAGSLALVAALVVSNLLPTLLWARHLWQGAWPLRFDPVLMRRLLAYGLPLSLLYALGTVMSNTDRLLLPWLVGADATGLYGAANGLSRQSLFLLMQAVNLAAFPLAVAAFKRGDTAEAVAQLKHNFLLLLGLGLPATAGLAVLAGPISRTMLGSAYAPAATHLLPWLAVSAFLMSLRSFYLDQAFQLAKNTRQPMINMIVTVVLAVPLSVFCIVNWGLAGAAYGTTAGFALSLALSWRTGQKAFPLPIPVTDSLWVALATLLMVAALWPLRSVQGFIPLACSIALGVGVYTLVIVLANVMGLRHWILKRLRHLRQL